MNGIFFLVTLVPELRLCLRGTSVPLRRLILLHVPHPGLFRGHWKVFTLCTEVEAKPFALDRRRTPDRTTDDRLGILKATRGLSKAMRKIGGDGRDIGLREDLNEDAAVHQFNALARSLKESGYVHRRWATSTWKPDSITVTPATRSPGSPSAPTITTTTTYRTVIGRTPPE